MNRVFSRSLVFGFVFVLGLGCGDDSGPTGGGQNVTAPPPPSMTKTEGHLSKEQRGLSLDDYDLQVLGTEISAEDLNEKFGLLALHVKYINWPALCAREGEGASVQPKATVMARLEEIQAAGIDVASQGLHVNVDVLTPGRSALHHICLAEGVDVRFDNLQLRTSMIAAFEDLAEVPGITGITVGLEMNRYYHLFKDGDRQIDDYTNWITLYRDIYSAIKAKNDAIEVGPGISWSWFRQRTMADIAEDVEGQDPGSIDAAYAAYLRTVEPLLVHGRNGEQTADFVAVSILPFVGEVPFERNPEAELGDYFSSMYLLFSSIDVPLVLAQVDWPENNARNKKARFLSVLKRELSPFEIMFLAWRRYSDLDEEHCPRFVNASDPALAYPRDYCDSGLVDKYGRPQPMGVSESDSVFSQLVAE